jgi:hypothetical protein
MDEKYPGEVLTREELAKRILPGEVPLEKFDAIHAVLADRGQKYGNFLRQSSIAQTIKNAIFLQASAELQADQREALHMIAVKISRIVNGDANYADSWVDIAGYAQLVADRLNAKS